MSNKKSPQTKAKKRSDGRTATSVSLTVETLEKAKRLAAEEGRPLSNWLEQLIKNLTIFILLASLLSWLLTGDPIPGAMLAFQAIGTAAYYAGVVALEVVAAIV